MGPQVLVFKLVSGGERIVVLVGQKRAVAIAVRNRQAKRRWMKLREWLSSADAETR